MFGRLDLIKRPVRTSASSQAPGLQATKCPARPPGWWLQPLRSRLSPLTATLLGERPTTRI